MSAVLCGERAAGRPACLGAGACVRLGSGCTGRKAGTGTPGCSLTTPAASAIPCLLLAVGACWQAPNLSWRPTWSFRPCPKHPARPCHPRRAQPGRRGRLALCHPAAAAPAAQPAPHRQVSPPPLEPFHSGHLTWCCHYPACEQSALPSAPFPSLLHHPSPPPPRPPACAPAPLPAAASALPPRRSATMRWRPRWQSAAGTPAFATTSAQVSLPFFSAQAMLRPVEQRSCRLGSKGCAPAPAAAAPASCCGSGARELKRRH